MIIIFISALIGIFSLQLFVINFKIQGLNRAVICTPIEIFYRDVYANDLEANFTVEQIEEHLREYYDVALKKYVDDYEVNFYFYNKEDYSMCLDSYCDGVEISVDAELNLSYKYHRVMYYELVG